MSVQAGEKVVKTTCYYWPCPQCGFLVHVKDGKITKMQPNPEHPSNKGTACMRGLTGALEDLYHPNRLLYPMKRVGGRGELKWQRISWDEALDTITERFANIIDRYGTTGICGVIGSPYRTHGAFLNLFMRSLASPNVMSDLNLCDGNPGIAHWVTFGEWINRYHFCTDVEKSACILLVGTNPAESFFQNFRMLREAKERGARFIIVDPRNSETVRRLKPDLHLQLRVGTDAALVLGMLNVIINEELYDREFVEKWCVGFDKLRERVQEFSVERVERIVEVPAAQIQEAARMFATTKPASFQTGVGVQQGTNSNRSLRAIAILSAITGNVDVEGGNLLLRTPPGYKSNAYLWESKEFRPPPEQEAKMLGAREFPLWAGPYAQPVAPENGRVWDAIISGDPYPIKGMYICSANPVLTQPDSMRVRRALERLEFIAVSEYRPNKSSSLFADILLPKRHWLESADVDAIYSPMGGNMILTVRQPVAPPLGETLDEVQIQIALLRRMEEKRYVKRSFIPWQSVEEFCEWRVKDTGVSYQDLQEKGFVTFPIQYKEYEKSGFKTPSGKVELYSSILEKYGYDPLLSYQEPAESPLNYPELAEKYPLLLLTGLRIYPGLHSRLVDCPSIRKKAEPYVEIHPEAARARDIKDGDWVIIENTKARRVKFKAKVTDSVPPNVVAAPHGHYYPEREAPEEQLAGCFESNINVLTSYDGPLDPVCAYPQAKGLLCQVRKA